MQQNPKCSILTINPEVKEEQIRSSHALLKDKNWASEMVQQERHQH